jgi:hypothetical protein
MGFSIEQDKDKVRASHRFQVSASLQDVQLLDCSASVSEAKMEIGGQLRLGLTMATGVLGLSEGNARFWVRIIIFGDPADASEQPEHHHFEIACRYALAYDMQPGYTPSPQEVDAFREGNAVFHCWPYSRELVQNMTMRMGLLIPPLPFLRLTPKNEPRKSSPKRIAKDQPKVSEEKVDD